MPIIFYRYYIIQFKAMKKILFIIICCYISFNVNAQWRRGCIPKDELTGAPPEWCYIYDEGEGKSIVFLDSGTLMISTKYQRLLTNQNGDIGVLVGIYKNGELISKGNFLFLSTSDKHIAGADGFKGYLELVKNGAVIRVIAHIENDFDFDVTTTKMPEKTRIHFAQPDYGHLIQQ